MNKDYIIIALLLFMLIVCAVYMVINFKKSENNNEQAVYENILSRKSVRKYIKDKEITDIQIEKILRAAMAAPSARNSQPWEFVIVKDKNILRALADRNPYGKMLYDASAAIIVLGNMEKVKGMDEFWSQDTSAATQNILLEVEALGLGAVWMGVYPVKDRMQTVSEIVELPEHIIPFNVISIGYPTGEEIPKDKWNPQNIHYDKY